jgi:hypothetical protein
MGKGWLKYSQMQQLFIPFEEFKAGIRISMEFVMNVKMGVDIVFLGWFGGRK